MSYSVSQNTSFLTAASIFQKAISFVYFTVIARLIGVENTGVYFFAIAFTTIFTVVADFGLGPVLTREAARYPDRAGEYLNTVLTAKLLLGLLAYGVVVLTTILLNYSPLTRHLIYLSGITMFLDNLHSAFYNILRARKNLVFESAGIIGSQLLTLIIGSLALFFKAPLYFLILAYTIPSGLNVVYSSFCVFKNYHIFFRPVINRALGKVFLLTALPFALAGIISRLYAYSDSLLMSKMLSAKELGFWSVPYKMTFAFQFIPAALSASIYPAMSELYLHAPERLGMLFSRSWRYLLALVMPLAFGLAAIASPIIKKLYTNDFLPAVPVLQILIFSLIFIFLSMLIGSTLNAINHQKWQTGLLALALGVNLILNIILLPRIGIVGAALAAFVSNLVLCASGLYLINKLLPLSLSLLSAYAWNAFYPALIMGASVYFLTPVISFYLTVPLGGLVYVALLFLNGTLSKDTIVQIWSKSTPNW